VPGEIKRGEPGTSETMHVGGETQTGPTALKVENMHTGVDETANFAEQEEPDRKKPRGLSLEEYEAALDQDTTFHDVDLDFDVS